MTSSEVKNRLYEMAKSALEKAYAPYSGVMVASAVLDSEGHIYAGVNVENVSFGLTMCAERNAIANAIAGGAKKIEAVLIMSSIGAIPPCGACRQVIAEFADEKAEIFLATRDGIEVETTIGELLPRAFGMEWPKKGCE